MTSSATSKLIAASAIALVLIGNTGSASAASRSALWAVVQSCVVGLTFLCQEITAPADGNELGYAVINSTHSPTEFLIVPAVQVAGVESPAARSTAGARLWQLAWDERHRVDHVLGRALPRTAVGLAVNSAGTRTQDQLHIHLECVSAKVQRRLASQAPALPGPWTALPKKLAGSHYFIKTVASANLSQINVLEEVANLPGATMSNASVAAIGAVLADGQDGFYLLVNFDNVSSERLLDHSCRDA